MTGPPVASPSPGVFPASYHSPAICDRVNLLDFPQRWRDYCCVSRQIDRSRASKTSRFRSPGLQCAATKIGRRSSMTISAVIALELGAGSTATKVKGGGSWALAILAAADFIPLASRSQSPSLRPSLRRTMMGRPRRGRQPGSFLCARHQEPVRLPRGSGRGRAGRSLARIRDHRILRQGAGRLQFDRTGNHLRTHADQFAWSSSSERMCSARTSTACLACPISPASISWAPRSSSATW